MTVSECGRGDGYAIVYQDDEQISLYDDDEQLEVGEYAETDDVSRLKMGITSLLEERDLAPRTVDELERKYTLYDMCDSLESFYSANFAEFGAVYNVDTSRAMKGYTTNNIDTYEMNVHDAAIVSAFVLKLLFPKETFRPHHDATVSLRINKDNAVDYFVAHEALRAIQDIYNVKPSTTIQTVSVEMMIVRLMVQQASLKELKSKKNDTKTENPTSSIKKVIRKARTTAIKELGKYDAVVHFDDLVEEHIIPEDEVWSKEQSYSAEFFLQSVRKYQKRRAKLAKKHAQKVA